MSDIELKRKDAVCLITEALPFLSAEQLAHFSDAVAGTALTNQLIVQMQTGAPGKILHEFMTVDIMQKYVG